MPPLIQTPPPTQTVPSAPAPPPPRQVEVIRPQEVRSLPGQLDAVPVFNSNSPEVIQEEGILVSAFPPAGMEIPEAHLNFPLEGRFDLFAHHIARGADPDDTRTLFLGMIVHNPGDEAVTLDVLQAVSYLSQDAPFIDLPSYVANPLGTVFAGPGSRAVNDILRGQRQTHWPAQVIIPPGENHLLMNAPIPLRRLTVATDGTLPPGYIIPPPPNVATPTTASTSLSGGLSSDSLDSNDSTSNSTTTVSSTNQVVVSPRPPAHRDVPINGRSTLMHLSSSGQVYVASLAMYAPKATGGAERVPTLVEWEELLKTSDLAGPRDRTPTSPDTSFFARFLYGRVAGIAQGSQWTALATDSPDVDYLSIPKPGEEFSYVISTVDHNTFGTEQIQSAPMLVRYPDTAYRAHGNYGVKYDISLPLYNTTESTQRVSVLFQTPIQDEDLEGALRFREPPDPQVFFRGTVRLRFTDNLGIPQTRYLHVVQHRGQQGDPLIQLVMPSGDRRLVEVQFIYPPDATPPQVITVQTMQDPNIIEVSN
ncbi:MAG: DUF3370 domain-containing protein [Cyanobacteria bacterium CRU_2_1]|nr:DUF3370 domain-containing protein [Cyanobacteria bacterium RU_5_0]NJR60547.1 DUF3370 domain-containing protein [Cyanobacteria bacterium CRU_2_1]